MNIHEYQAKELLQKFDVATTRGTVASTLDEAEQIARELGDIDIVVKAQIHAGGRGKGAFTNGFKGGCTRSQDAGGSARCAAKMLGGDSGHASDRASWSQGQQSARSGIRRHLARDLLPSCSTERRPRL